MRMAAKHIEPVRKCRVRPTSFIRRLVGLLLCCAFGHAQAYDVADYEEDAGLSVSIFRSPDGDVYGGGLESGVWLRGAPVFGDLFGHWVSNKLQEGNYYNLGMTVRLMPRTVFAPFVGGGGGYAGLISERSGSGTAANDFREADSQYWSGLAEAGFRIWFGGGRRFLESGYRYHWTTAGSEFDHGVISIKWGERF